MAQDYGNEVMKASESPINPFDGLARLELTIDSMYDTLAPVLKAPDTDSPHAPFMKKEDRSEINNNYRELNFRIHEATNRLKELTERIDIY